MRVPYFMKRLDGPEDDESVVWSWWAKLIEDSDPGCYFIITESPTKPSRVISLFPVVPFQQLFDEIVVSNAHAVTYWGLTPDTEYGKVAL